MRAMILKDNKHGLNQVALFLEYRKYTRKYINNKYIMDQQRGSKLKTC